MLYGATRSIERVSHDARSRCLSLRLVRTPRCAVRDQSRRVRSLVVLSRSDGLLPGLAQGGPGRDIG